MIDDFLFVGLPYIALAVCIFGTIYRLRSQGFSQSALSSQFLEGRQLLLGSVPWHIGIGVIILAHLLVLCFPGVWQSLMANPVILYTVETAGVALGILALVGLLVLIVRRVTSARIQAVTSVMDLVIAFLLAGQVALGIVTALAYRWGAMWAPSTAVPYIWSLVTLHPDASYVTGLPLAMKGHIIGAWLVLLLIPFSRLVHIFALPLGYLFRPPQKVVWTNPRHQESADYLTLSEKQAARRYFLTGAAGMVAGGAFLTAGTADKFFRFFFGPRLSEHEQAEFMALKVKRLEKTVEQKKYELERQQNEHIFIAKLSELSEAKGKYFTDYQMMPALAFRDTDGLPLLISAKCTHLGCTVGSDVTDGKILCPCHVSWFDVHSGKPNADSPAKAPLPHLGWVVMDKEGKVVASRRPGGPVEGRPDLSEPDRYSVFIAKYHAEEA